MQMNSPQQVLASKKSKKTKDGKGIVACCRHDFTCDRRNWAGFTYFANHALSSTFRCMLPAEFKTHA
jgi:hypothetical protein